MQGNNSQSIQSRYDPSMTDTPHFGLIDGHKTLYPMSAPLATMDPERERRPEFPELNPDRTRTAGEDQAETRGRREPKPRATPRRQTD